MLKTDPLDDQSSYDKSSSNITAYFLVISAASLLLVYAVMEIQSIRAEKKQKGQGVSGINKISATGKATIGGDWKLLTTEGGTLGSIDLEGTYYLIYFGFTNCPDICPNSLMKLAKALEKVQKMPEDKYFKLKTIFVSVDPDRDTP